MIKITNYEPKKRWLEFEEWKKDPNNKTKRLLIHNQVTGDGLGEIRWHNGWRQYVFDDGHIFLAEGCLYELFETINNLRKERENKKKAPNSEDFRHKKSSDTLQKYEGK